jgi:hypothetical protein
MTQRRITARSRLRRVRLRLNPALFWSKQLFSVVFISLSWQTIVWWKYALDFGLRAERYLPSLIDGTKGRNSFGFMSDAMRNVVVLCNLFGWSKQIGIVRAGLRCLLHEACWYEEAPAVAEAIPRWPTLVVRKRPTRGSPLTFAWRCLIGESVKPLGSYPNACPTLVVRKSPRLAYGDKTLNGNEVCDSGNNPATADNSA